MEFFQAFLFTSKYILGRNANLDIFYIFAAVVLLFYIWKRHDKAIFIVKLSGVSAIFCVLVGMLLPWAQLGRSLVFWGKLVLDITIMVYVATNCHNWKMIRFLETIVWIQAIETAIAMLFPMSDMWVYDSVGSSLATIKRLRLFYLDAGVLAFVSGLVLVMLVYQLLTEEVVWRYVLGIIVMLVDLYYSYGLSGIATAVLAIAIMLIMTLVTTKNKVGLGQRIKYLCGIFLAAVLSVTVFVGNSIYASRINAVVDGSDAIFYQKVIQPLSRLGEILQKTYFMGVGFGNGNSYFALDLLGGYKAIPNSFLRIICEGGVIGILLVGMIVVGLFYYSFKYGNAISKALCVYIITYQFVGGYFLDPINFFVYGWIMGDCLRSKYEIEGRCRIGLFIPQKKEVLSVAMIGHKRMPSREGGVEIVVEELSVRMAERGHQITVYNRSGNHVAGLEYNSVNYEELKEYKGVKIIKVPTVQKKGFAAMMSSLLASLHVVLGNYDVVHYHAEGPCAFIWIPALFGIRTVATIHGLDWQRSGKWGSMASNFIKMGEKLAAAYADEIIVLSRHVQQYFLDNYNRKTHFIPNGVDRPESKEANVVTEKWGLKKDSYILLLARLTNEKGFHYAVEAYKNIDSDKKLVIAGGSSDTDRYVEQLKKLAEGDDRIIFTGFVQGDALYELYSNAYIYCLPSDIEGMPISLLEAMSYGNCCLVSDIEECTSVVGNYGKSFVKSNVNSLREELQNLIDHPEVVQDAKAKSVDYVCKKYQWDDVVDNTLKIYMDEIYENINDK